MLLDLISDELNLRWAWDKVRTASVPGDIWIDEIAIADFELNLEEKLSSIAAAIKKGTYSLSRMRPMAFPKNPNKDGSPQIRQYFNVPVLDQVAWTAVVNILGPYVDNSMPPWSYGNRLFRNVWIDVDSEGGRQLRIGRYRHSAGRIYTRFQQGWPRFRRHVYLTVRAMSATHDPTIDARQFEQEEDLQELKYQRELAQEHRCPFVLPEYWPDAGGAEVFWCSIDLAKFYPSLKLQAVRENILKCLPENFRPDASKLLHSMLRFPMDLSGWEPLALKELGISPTQTTFHHVPTGLFVAGFLANAALLTVDEKISERLAAKEVAHFRYVDDHILLATNFNALVDWIRSYQLLLTAQETGAKINFEKTEPSELGLYLKASNRGKNSDRLAELASDARKACTLDPMFPTPLMTKTLALVSAIGRTDFELLDADELSALTNQLEHLLLVDLSEQEIPEKTRLAFAASRLAQLAEHVLSAEQIPANAAAPGAPIPTQASLFEVASHGSGPSSSPEGHTEIGARASYRIFHLLRKVLSDRPDRTRLWTRAIQLCRQVGVKGVARIIADIEKIRASGQGLAADYLLANTLALIGTNLVIAARVCIDADEPSWRRSAARVFLDDVASCHAVIDRSNTTSWYIEKSWHQFAFAHFCAHSILSENHPDLAEGLAPDVVSEGRSLIMSPSNLRSSEFLWWIARIALRDLEPRAPSWLISIARQTYDDGMLARFWRFFPFDVSADVLRSLKSSRKEFQAPDSGWWADVFRKRADEMPLAELAGIPNARVAHEVVFQADRRAVSLLDWVEFCDQLLQRAPSDPRASEWTALEIVIQIAGGFPDRLQLSPEALSSNLFGAREREIQPYNFLVPMSWIDQSDTPTWERWGEVVKDGVQVHESFRVDDRRYTPLVFSPIHAELNVGRALGLILYGLLRRSFALPAAWNGPGHASVLRALPSMLLRDVTCSTLTLGLLQSCLLPRSAENLAMARNLFVSIYLDEDTKQDPMQILGAADFAGFAKKCQSELERYQLSTLNHQARQLTPVSIRLLSSPDWHSAFNDSES